MSKAGKVDAIYLHRGSDHRSRRSIPVWNQHDGAQYEFVPSSAEAIGGGQDRSPPMNCIACATEAGCYFAGSDCDYSFPSKATFLSVLVAVLGLPSQSDLHRPHNAVRARFGPTYCPRCIVEAELYAIDITFLVLAALCVGARLYVRIRAKHYGLEDWLAVVAQICLFVNIGLKVIMIENGLGLQAENLDINNQIMIAKAIYAAETEYLIGIGDVKVSILIMYCRIFDTQPFRLAAWIIGSITVLWTVLFILLCIFQCTPIPRAWDLRIPGKCLNLNALWIGNAIPNIITDVVILAMPIHPVWKLCMRRSQRIAVTGIFLLGGFVVVASVYRLTQILTLDALNLAYTLKGGTTFGYVELAVAIMSCCLPTLKPPFVATLRFTGLSSKGSSPGHGPGSGTASCAGRSLGASHQGKHAKAAGFTVIEELGSGRRTSEVAGSEVSITRGHKPSRSTSSGGGGRRTPKSLRRGSETVGRGSSGDDDVSLGEIRVQHDVEVVFVRAESAGSDAELAEQWEDERSRRRYPSGSVGAPAAR